MDRELRGQENLVQFLTTLQPKAGQTAREVLRDAVSMMNAGGPKSLAVRGVFITRAGGWRLSVDVHRPLHGHAWPVLLLCHGGGFVMGNTETHDRMARQFAAGGYLVISVDYPRAPRWRFPAGLEGCRRALLWAADTAAEYGGDPNSLSIAGDSAGANLASAVAVTASPEFPRLQAAILMYGLYDFHRALPVLANVVGGRSAEDQQYVVPQALEGLRSDPRLNPIVAPDRYPPTWIATGTADPLHAESLSLAERLDESGVRHEIFIADGAPHSFMQLPFLQAHDAAYSSAINFLDCTVKGSE